MIKVGLLMFRERAEEVKTGNLTDLQSLLSSMRFTDASEQISQLALKDNRPFH